MVLSPSDDNIHAKTWKILIIDDDEDDFIIAREMLREARGQKVDIHWADTYEKGVNELVANAYNAVLVDYDLGRRSGIEIIREATAHAYESPLILFTGRGSYEVDLEAMQAGATLYLTKGEANPLLLERLIRYAIELKQKEKALRDHEAQLKVYSEELEKSEKKFSMSFRASPVGIAISTVTEGRFVEVNDSYTELFGYRRDELIGHTSLELGMFPDPQERRAIVRLFQKHNGFRNYEVRLLTKSGELRDVLFSTERFEVDGQDCMLSLVVDITGRKQIERELREHEAEQRQSEAMLREFLEGTHDMFLALREDWSVAYANRRFAEVMGRQLEDLLGQNFWEAFPNFIGQPVEAVCRQVMRDRVPVHFEPKGEYPDLWDVISVYPTSEGIMAFIADRTEERREEAAHRDSENRLQEFIESTHDSFFILGFDWRVLYFNRRATEILGASAEEMIGKVYWEVFPRYLGTPVEANFRKAMEERVPVQYQLGGIYTTYWYDVSIYPSSDGISVFAADRTAERKAHDALRKLSEAVEQSPVSVVITDLKGNIEYVNPKFTQLTGYTLEEALGQNPRILKSGLTPPDTYKDLWQTLLSGKTWRGEFANRKKNGDLYWEAVSISPIMDQEGTITHFVAVKEDITGQKQAQEALAESARQLERSNRELEQFAFVASHDLQEPLRKVRLFGDRLVELVSATGSGEAKDYLDRMQNAAERMQRMIDGLLTLSRVSTRGGNFTSIDLNVVVEEALSDLEARLHATGGQVTVGDLPGIEADELQIRQLFQNLINNALKFHAPQTAPRVTVSGRIEGEGKTQQAVLQVADQGIGFDPQYEQRIFQPFQRLHGISEFEGTGLGLAICQKIVERHHGAITVESQPGVGTVFTITLPVKQANA
jgi:PAS domain S-box-containing protein